MIDCKSALRVGVAKHITCEGATRCLRMKIVVTCGPSYEPIDQARRITNFSTGRLGIALANALSAEGWRVICFKGEQATCADPLQVQAVHGFSTNQDLANRLHTLSRE